MQKIYFKNKTEGYIIINNIKVTKIKSSKLNNIQKGGAYGNEKADLNQGMDTIDSDMFSLFGSLKKYNVSN